MILCLEGVLDTAECDAAREALAAAPFLAGAHTAGAQARPLKCNEQLAARDPLAKALSAKVEQSLRAHPVAAAGALPLRFARILISRYRAGMAYGTHIDEPVINGTRTDLSFTLFLSGPDSYEGGALVLDTATGEQAFRLPAGSAVLYPSGARHRVETVTTGERLAAVGWLQSEVRDPAAREILLDLSAALAELPEGAEDVRLRLDSVRASLRRRWSEL